MYEETVVVDSVEVARSSSVSSGTPATLLAHARAAMKNPAAKTILGNGGREKEGGGRVSERLSVRECSGEGV